MQLLVPGKKPVRNLKILQCRTYQNDSFTSIKQILNEAELQAEIRDLKMNASKTNKVESSYQLVIFARYVYSVAESFIIQEQNVSIKMKFVALQTDSQAIRWCHVFIVVFILYPSTAP